MDTPKVFISYSWDSDAHKDWVRQLADRLVTNGVEVRLDQYDMDIGDNLTHYMERAVADSDMILLILTENYKTKAEGRKGGVGFEYSMINAAWYQQQAKNTKFIPVLRGEKMETSSPVFVNAYLHLDMRDDAGLDAQLKDLLHRIFNVPKAPRPTLGKRPDFANNTSIPTKPPKGSTEEAIKTARDQQAKEKQARLAKQLREKIANNRTKIVIQELLGFADQKKDSDFRNEVIMQSTAYESYQKDKRLGITTHSEQQVSLAKINTALLEIIDGL